VPRHIVPPVFLNVKTSGSRESVNAASHFLMFLLMLLLFISIVFSLASELGGHDALVLEERVHFEGAFLSFAFFSNAKTNARKEH
jgi:hypothetical protein